MRPWISQRTDQSEPMRRHTEQSIRLLEVRRTRSPKNWRMDLIETEDFPNVPAVATAAMTV